jgi:hypothetical protein
MTGARRGSIIAATWLIGIGIVFLVRQALDLPWGHAWPMFVILVGVASLVSTALAWRPSLGGLWAFTWPVAWIAVGSVLLASTTGSLDQGPLEWLEASWPWLAIGLGAWFLIGALVPGGRPVEALAIPLAGAPTAAVKVRFGAGVLRIGRAAAGVLVDGRFEGGVEQRQGGPGRIELSQDTTYGLPWVDHASNGPSG